METYRFDDNGDVYEYDVEAQEYVFIGRRLEETKKEFIDDYEGCGADQWGY